MMLFKDVIKLFFIAYIKQKKRERPSRQLLHTPDGLFVGVDQVIHHHHLMPGLDKLQASM